MGIKDQASEAATKAQDQVTEFARTAEAKINEKRKTAASALEDTAERMHRTADSLPAGERVTNIGHAAADKIESAADYLGEHDARDMMSDLTRFVKSHPGRSLIAALAAGFLVGRAFRRR